MGHKKSKKVDSASKVVTVEFKRSVQISHKLFPGEDGPAASGLSGAVLRRRKAATLSYMDAVSARYADKYPGLDIPLEWARFCATLTCSVDRADLIFRLSLAAAIWLLDALCESCSLGMIESIIPLADTDPYEAEYIEPRYDNDVILGMVRLILQRDGEGARSAGLITPAAARRAGPVEWADAGKKSGPETNRERFNLAMSQLRPELAAQAVKKFEDKVWEFADRYFACAAEYTRMERRLRDRVAQIDSECRQIYRDAGVVPECDLIPADRPKYPLAVPPALSDGPWNGDPDALPAPQMEQIKGLLEEGYARQDEADKVMVDHYKMGMYACVLPVLEGEDLLTWQDTFSPEIRRLMEGFTVDDPYEMCFAFLYMIEAGSELPWLYAPAVAVLMAAAVKLPWNVPAPGLPGLYELEFGDGDADVEERMEHPDVSAKKADLYSPKYRPDILPHPLDPEGPYQDINLPQLIYGLTGLIMPRSVPDTDKVTEALIRAGVPAAEAPVWEKYLRLADEFQRLECFSSDARLRQRESRAAEIAGLDVPLPIESLAEEYRALKKQLSDARSDLHTANRAVRDEHARLERAMSEAAQERQELADLRELVFNLESEPEPESEEPPAGQTPYQVRRRTLVFGGRDSWQRAMRELLPSVNFVRRDANITPDMFRRAEVIWFQTNYLSHSYYYKVVEMARSSGTTIRYFTSSGAGRCAEQLADADRQTRK